MSKEDIIFGLRPILEAIQSGKSIEKIYAKQGLAGELFNELKQTAFKFNIPLQTVPGERINKFATGNHQGVVAIISPVQYHNLEEIVKKATLDGEQLFIIILDGITDVRNFGAIARTSECAGIHAIVVPNKGSAPINADAIKTSAGALFRLPVCKVQKPWYALKFLKESGFTVIAVSEKGDSDYRTVDYNGNIALVFGAEDRGISSQILKMCDKTAAIPLKGETGSLNVSVAAGILMFEAIRNRKIHTTQL